MNEFHTAKQEVVEPPQFLAVRSVYGLINRICEESDSLSNAVCRGSVAVDSAGKVSPVTRHILSPHDRFVIALHSLDGVGEIGLCLCPAEKSARKLARGVRGDTFSNAI